MIVFRAIVTAAVFIAIWWAITQFAPIPEFMLPPPQSVAVSLWTNRDLLFWNTLTTLAEILAGLCIGSVLGALAGLGIVFSAALQRWLMPVLVLSQAIPVFALAPLLVLWFGFGMTSKALLATLFIFFPVTANFADGLRRTDPAWLDLARTMNASRWTMMRHIRLPSALPALASGMRVAAAVAPIGAILGEYAGASSGLGYVMNDANARIETDLMFAALFILSVVAVGLYMLVDLGLRHLLYWVPETGRE